jgi:hypothetical protein
MGTQLLERAFASFDEGALAGAIEPLAVNAHARRDDEPLDRLRGKTFEQNSRALRVVLRVVSDLVHALTNTHHCSEMEDAINATQRAFYRLSIANITAYEFDFARKTRRPSGACAMHLRRKTIEHANGVAAIE